MEVVIPKSLSRIKPPIEGLYGKGDLSLMSGERCVAVVGSRRMTSYGQRVIDRVIPSLVDAGVNIVSGFMYGVDQAAHKAALECGGKTIAVLGWGIDRWVATEDEKLYKEIERKGLILSEYEGERESEVWMFPQRNRIVAGLCQAVLVVEAAEKSGSLITADLASKFKRKLFAVPGPVTSKVSEGVNNLIKGGKAVMATSATDILMEMGWDVPARVVPAGGKRHRVARLLERESLSIDEMAKALKMSVEKLGVELSLMQLRGEIEEKDGKFYLQGS